LRRDPERTEATGTSGTRLECQEVSVVYSGVVALEKVSISLSRGEVVGLIGPNGAGKTTFVNAVSGFAPTSGRVLLGGRDLAGLSPEQRARLGLARTFQHGRLFPGLSVRENVELGALAVGASQRVARARAERLLAELGLSELADRSASELSHGDQQRVSVVRAAAAEPAFLLLDEPAAGLPETAIAELGKVVWSSSREGGAGVVMIDHNVEFVLRLSDRVVVLDHGVVLAEGTPEEIRRHPAVTAAYFGDRPEPAGGRVR
jgi:branched-chain amino acid transport system ATP-binding protein